MVIKKSHKKKMCHALWAMSTLKKDCQQRYKLNSYQYKIVREKYATQIKKK